MGQYLGVGCNGAGVTSSKGSLPADVVTVTSDLGAFLPASQPAPPRYAGLCMPHRELTADQSDQSKHR